MRWASARSEPASENAFTSSDHGHHDIDLRVSRLELSDLIVQRTSQADRISDGSWRQKREPQMNNEPQIMSRFAWTLVGIALALALLVPSAASAQNALS